MNSYFSKTANSQISSHFKVSNLKNPSLNRAFSPKDSPTFKMLSSLNNLPSTYSNLSLVSKINLKLGISIFISLSLLRFY